MDCCLKSLLKYVIVLFILDCLAKLELLRKSSKNENENKQVTPQLNSINNEEENQDEKENNQDEKEENQDGGDGDNNNMNELECVGLNLFPLYLSLCQQIIQIYNLEPAGSKVLVVFKTQKKMDKSNEI